MFQKFIDRVSFPVYTERATRDKFKKKCTSEGVSMSQKVDSFMKSEVSDNVAENG